MVSFLYLSPVPVSPLPLNGEDKLSQLQDLVQKGERKGVFNEGIPAEIERSVRHPYHCIN